MRQFVLLLALTAGMASPAAAQAPLTPPAIKPLLSGLRDHLDEHRATRGATAELTTARHQLRDWVEAQLANEAPDFDPRRLAERLHAALAGASLLCDDFQDECYSNLLGYLDDVRLTRESGFLVVIVPIGISCGYDESAYVYATEGGKWRRIWELEQDRYTEKDYLPQAVHDVQISMPGGGQRRLLMLLGSQTTCGGSFKDLYVKAWRMEPAASPRQVIDWSVHASDGYPPIQGRISSDDVLVTYTTGGVMSGDGHTAIRHFRIDGDRAAQVDPIADLPRDFVVEWLTNPWEEVRTRTSPASLESAHAQLYRSDGVGDFPEGTLRCTGGSDEWQVLTHMYEGPKKYYRVRWQQPFTFTMIGVSDAAYADCTITDSRGETHQNVIQAELR